MSEGVNRPLAPDYPPPAGTPPGRASSGHGIDTCKCGAVLAQCRCMGPHTPRVVAQSCAACRAPKAPTFKTAAEARSFIEANASLPETTLREALDHIVRVAWQTGHSSRDVEVKAADELLLTIDTLRPRIAAFIARPDTHLSGSHADAVMLVEAVHRALGGNL